MYSTSKKYQLFLQFQFLRSRGCPTNPFRTLSLCFGVTGKTPGLISRNNFVTKKLSASAIAIMFWQDVTRSSLCSGVKKCGTKCAHKFLLPKSFFQYPKNYSVRDVQRFCYHSWCDSTVIFDQISKSGNFYLSSSRFWTATSLVIYHFPSVSKYRIPPKNVDRFRASFP